MDCGKAAVSQEWGELLFSYDREWARLFAGKPDVCFLRLDSEEGVAYYRRSRYPLSMADFGYREIPKLYGPMDLTAAEEVGAVWAANQPFLQLRGREVIVGFVDSGIDLRHSAFRDEAGESRVVGLWDQTDTGGVPPKEFGYGSAYDAEELRRLVGRENGGSAQEEPLPGVDESGHGTFLAGLAAGSPDPTRSFTGAAPEARIAVVKLQTAKKYLRDYYFLEEEAVAYQENDIMAGLCYLKELQARLRRPMVICLGLGSSLGGHTGSSPLARMLERMSEERGTAVVVPAGNEANSSHHMRGSLGAVGETVAVEVRVPADCRGFVLEFWGRKADRFGMGLRAPGGEQVELQFYGAGGSGTYDFFLEGSRVYAEERSVGNEPGGELIFLRFQTPSPGVWTLEVRGRQILDGRFDLWLPLRGFVKEGTAFLRPDPDVTLTEPAGAERLISVGGLDHRGGGIDPASGRGYTRDGKIKPDLAAPSMGIYGPLPGGRYGSRSGTSCAAALTAGVAACLLEWGTVKGNEPYMGQQRIKDYLIRGAKRRADLSYPNREWGYGAVDLEGVFRS